MRIHGEWKIDLVRNVLVRSFAGSFNAQGSQALFEEVQRLAPRGQAWASLAHGSYWEMSTPDSLQAYGKMRDWALDNGCQRIAFLLPSQLHLQIVMRQSGLEPDPRFRHCETLEAACLWLSEQGFMKDRPPSRCRGYCCSCVTQPARQRGF